MNTTGLETRHWHQRLLGLFRAKTAGPTVEAEITAGLSNPSLRTLPARLLYDAKGSALFDAICQTPEYYPTRTELKLLQEVAPRIAAKTQPEVFVELGSGMARKTHVLLQAFGASHRSLLYVPVDVSELSLQHALETLLPRFPGLLGKGVVGDFQHSPWPQTQGRRLVAFLGGTLGNFDEPQALNFLLSLHRRMSPGDFLLLGMDLHKDESLLHAAYNDAQGLTRDFNLNLLHRLHHEFGVALRKGDFVHEAFFVLEHSQIEMHLRACRESRLKSEGLGLDFTLQAGESIRSEISRKPVREDLELLIEMAGFELEEVFVAAPPYALVLAQV